MPTLFVNTALKQTHVALFKNMRLLSEKKWDGYFHEYDTLLPNIHDLLTKHTFVANDLKRCVVCRGPGGFTSVRLGVSTVNALCFALDIEAAGLSLFELWKEQYGDVHMFIEANREEIFMDGVLYDIDSLKKKLNHPCKGIGQVTHLKNDLDMVEWVTDDAPLSLPWDKLMFSKEIVQPWYYKEARITDKP